jgi:hypothetical protein
MIFQQTWQQVMDGSKTRTRRLWKEGDSSMGYVTPIRLLEEFRVTVGVVDLNGRPRWQTDKEYAVQPGRGQKAVGCIQINGIHLEHLQDITEDDAIAEGARAWDADLIGVSARDSFSGLWNTIHTKRGERWEDNPLVWVLEFEVVNE